MKTGIDIVKISRIEKLIGDTSFTERFFSKKEQQLFAQKNFQANTIAGNFAAKEAFSKALGTGIRGFELSEISVLRDNLGKPYFEFSKKLNDTLKNSGITHIDVSISHEKEYAIASVVFVTDARVEAINNILKKETYGERDISSQKICKYLLPRNPDSHKGDYGKILSICGSAPYMGAAIMSAKSAFKCGSALITLVCGKSLNGAYRMAISEMMTCPLNDNDGVILTDEIPSIINASQKCDIILSGCGLTNCESTKAITKSLILSDIRCPVVLDADSINVLEGNADILKKAKIPIILTPHLMEFSRLSGINIEYIKENRKDVAREFAKNHNVFLVLKSEKTIVATPNGDVYENIHGNPGMAKGGSGDVLAGCITSFTGQNIIRAQKSEDAIYDAILRGVLTGVYIYSLSGDMACYDKGEDGMTPSDIIDNIPYAVKYIKSTN